MRSEMIKVLLAEDDEDDFLIIRDYLSEGYDTKYIIQWANSYKSASDLINKNRYDIILLDYNLDERNGLELLQEVKVICASIPVILLTGQVDPKVDFEAMKVGVTEYLNKNEINASLLERSIRYAVKNKRLEEEVKKYANNLEKMAEERTEQLREKDAQLIQAEKLAAIGEIAAGVAHEINQPLGGISLITQGVLKAKRLNKLDDFLLEEKLNSLLEQVDRINSIITHLRSFARQSDNVLQEIDINQPILDVFKLIGQQFINRNISIQLNLGENLPLILAERYKLEQVFLNIISNARDALESHEANIAFSKVYTQDRQNPSLKYIIINTLEKNNFVVVEIIDNGPGIPKSIVNKIFNPFFTTKEVGKGTGLGLSISYSIIKGFNGTIEVETSETGGTKFIIKIPAKNI